MAEEQVSQVENRKALTMGGRRSSTLWWIMADVEEEEAAARNLMSSVCRIGLRSSVVGQVRIINFTTHKILKVHRKRLIPQSAPGSLNNFSGTLLTR